jgi:hypothetical protein
VPLATLELCTGAQGAVKSNLGHFTVPKHNKETTGRPWCIGEMQGPTSDICYPRSAFASSIS